MFTIWGREGDTWHNVGETDTPDDARIAVRMVIDGVDEVSVETPDGTFVPGRDFLST